MSSPASRHALKSQAAKINHTRGIQATGYELMLIKLASDRRQLKQVQSMERKADVKLGMIKDYAVWIEGVIEGDSGIQDDVLMTVMLWCFDAGEIEQALKLAQYALKHNLAMPAPHQRQTACLIAEESALAQFRNFKEQKAIDLDVLLKTLDLVDKQDMPDEVRANLHKIIGYGHRQENQLVLALNHLQRAQALDDRAGCKKDIERLTKEINLLNE